MSAREVCAGVLLVPGVALALICAAGMVLMGDPYERLHYVGPTALSAIAIAAAIFVQESFSLIAVKAFLIAGFLLTSSPVLTHFTSRGFRGAEHGDWRIQPGESPDRVQR